MSPSAGASWVKTTLQSAIGCSRYNAESWADLDNPLSALCILAHAADQVIQRCTSCRTIHSQLGFLCRLRSKCESACQQSRWGFKWKPFNIHVRQVGVQNIKGPAKTVKGTTDLQKASGISDRHGRVRGQPESHDCNAARSTETHAKPGHGCKREEKALKSRVC